MTSGKRACISVVVGCTLWGLAAGWVLGKEYAPCRPPSALSWFASFISLGPLLLVGDSPVGYFIDGSDVGYLITSLFVAGGVWTVLTYGVLTLQSRWAGRRTREG